MYTKFHKDRFRHSEVDRGEYTDSMVISYAYFYFFQNKGNRPKEGGLQFVVHKVSALFATSHSTFLFIFTYCTHKSDQQ
jgi:hypothetical protein